MFFNSVHKCTEQCQWENKWTWEYAKVGKNIMLEFLLFLILCINVLNNTSEKINELENMLRWVVVYVFSNILFKNCNYQNILSIWKKVWYISSIILYCKVNKLKNMLMKVKIICMSLYAFLCAYMYLLYTAILMRSKIVVKINLFFFSKDVFYYFFKVIIYTLKKKAK